MPQELVTFGSDRRLVLRLGEAIRQPVWGTNWQRCRIAIQGGLVGADNWNTFLTGTPTLAFGMIAGASTSFGSFNTTHAVGVATDVLTWSWTTGSPPLFDISNINAQPRAFVRVNGVTTFGSVVSSSSRFPAVQAVRCCWACEIVKGNPNYTIYSLRPGGDPAARTDVTDSQFQQIMELGPNMTGFNNILSGYNLSSWNMAVDETANGALTHIFVYWNRVSIGFSFNIRHRKLA